MIEQILIIAFTVFAIWQVLQEGHILHKLGIVLEKLPEWLHKPVFTCPICMTFWYGILICWVLGFQFWLVAPAMGLLSIIIQFMPDE